MRKIEQACGEHFEGEELDLSGAKILCCLFHNCKITFTAPAVSYQNQFLECEFNVPAAEVWRWLMSAIPSSMDA